jgi:hypothetical protein
VKYRKFQCSEGRWYLARITLTAGEKMQPGDVCPIAEPSLHSRVESLLWEVEHNDLPRLVTIADAAEFAFDPSGAGKGLSLCYEFNIWASSIITRKYWFVEEITDTPGDEDNDILLPEGGTADEIVAVIQAMRRKQ